MLTPLEVKRRTGASRRLSRSATGSPRRCVPINLMVSTTYAFPKKLATVPAITFLPPRAQSCIPPRPFERADAARGCRIELAQTERGPTCVPEGAQSRPRTMFSCELTRFRRGLAGRAVFQVVFLFGTRDLAGTYKGAGAWVNCTRPCKRVNPAWRDYRPRFEIIFSVARASPASGAFGAAFNAAVSVFLASTYSEAPA